MEAQSYSAPIPAEAAATEVTREQLASLIRRYIYAATLVLLVAGALGVLMRQSQADIAPLGANFFYAAMTAHGLGTFVSWAAFSVMGFSLWVLSESGLEVRPLGYRLAQVTWWATVAGTVGIVVTTLFMGFAGSWVFLYPLPFFSAGQWGDAATAIFAASVLAVGIGILTWCTAILHTVVGPSSPAERDGAWNRLGVGLGLGILFPRRFPVRTGLMPYPIIPLTVIAIDMLIATLPLAALLVVMIIQSFDPSVTVDPLLAKNMLWFFGHPVVYLLLFPAVSIYYLLIPRYAKRPLAAANVIGAAWLVAVVTNVTIWAHHIYLDYPQNSFQGTLNLAMQPLTFSITVVSALSVYSLAATIYRSDFDWNPASKFLVAGIIGWFTAGLSGVVNATIVLDASIHNTLWIVGHFHHMAMLNIGAVVFAGVYAFMPGLTGHELYSRRLGNWHLWLTMIGGYGTFIPWYVQGLLGAPRRYAVLPSTYDAWTLIAIPFVLLLAIGQLIFAYNLIQTVRGKRRANDSKPFFADERLVGLAGATVTVALIVPLVAIPLTRIGPVPAGPAPAATAPPGAAAPASGPGAGGGTQSGKELFASTCGSCHTLSSAGTTGTLGPNLDQLKPSAPTVLNAIKIGGAGSGTMPPNLLSGAEAKAVADYISSSTH